MQGIEAQFLALQKGFHEVIPGNLLKQFDERELEVGSTQAVIHHNTPYIARSPDCSSVAGHLWFGKDQRG